MADVGIRELKARLSEYVERAARGEMIRVTDRGLPKALLVPVPGRTRIDEGTADGWIRPARGTPHGPWKRFPASRRLDHLLEEDRDG